MHPFDLDDGNYNELLSLPNNQHFVEQLGVQENMEFLFDNWWLRDKTVTDNIVKRNKMWEIQIGFCSLFATVEIN